MIRHDILLSITLSFVMLYRSTKRLCALTLPSLHSPIQALLHTPESLELLEHSRKALDLRPSLPYLPRRPLLAALDTALPPPLALPLRRLL